MNNYIQIRDEYKLDPDRITRQWMLAKVHGYILTDDREKIIEFCALHVNYLWVIPPIEDDYYYKRSREFMGEYPYTRALDFFFKYYDIEDFSVTFVPLAAFVTTVKRRHLRKRHKAAIIIQRFVLSFVYRPNSELYNKIHNHFNQNELELLQKNT